MDRDRPVRVRDTLWNRNLWLMRFAVPSLGATLVVALPLASVTQTSPVVWLVPCGIILIGGSLLRCLRSALIIDRSNEVLTVRNPFATQQVAVADVTMTGWRRGWMDDDVVVIGFRSASGARRWQTVWALDVELIGAVPVLSTLPRAGRIGLRERLG